MWDGRFAKRTIWLPGGIQHTAQTFYIATPLLTGTTVLPAAATGYQWVLRYLRILVSPNQTTVVTLRNDDGILFGPIDYHNRTAGGVEQERPIQEPFGPDGLEVGGGKTLKLTTADINTDKIWGSVRQVPVVP